VYLGQTFLMKLGDLHHGGILMITLAGLYKGHILF